jgi:PKHD-type hydroxylase
MNISNYYWYFTSVIPPRICDMIVQYGKAEKQREVLALTGGLKIGRDLKKEPLSQKELKDLKKKRDSNIVWMNDKWIYKEIQPYVNQANRNAGWNFEWDWSESCQFTKYKKGQYYDWHCDSWDKPYVEEGPTKGKIRKLSMTCQLTDGSEYEGGELEFDFRNYDPHMRDESKHRIQCKEILPKGSIIVFPSFVWHRVKPVTKGVRYSLVVWNLGYPFK